ncbi:LysR substrate-binding domain-containing protein [Pollutimonas nitritireducens]|nr:LysR substrate-binding domain-containing protein [Pollutimonas nitritireducens]
MKGSRDSLKSLRIFISAAQTLNFSRSAEELSLTQSAVSKHIFTLEQRLGTALFDRKARGLELTYAGIQYLKRIGPAVHLIDEASALVAHSDARAALNVVVSPSFAHFCLLPNLSEFFAKHPHIKLNIRPRLLYEPQAFEPFDAAIQLHTGHAGGLSTEYLCGREMALVAAPDLVQRERAFSIADLDRLVLLKRAQRGYNWSEWRAVMAPNWSGPPADAPEYEGFSMLLPAVTHGLGAAIAPLCMTLDALDQGTVVRPLGEAVIGRYAYYLMKPAARRYDPHVEAFSDWVMYSARQLQQRVNDFISR